MLLHGYNSHSVKFSWQELRKTDEKKVSALDPSCIKAPLLAALFASLRKRFQLSLIWLQSPDPHDLTRAVLRLFWSLI